jgi:ubiquinone/menaquinone biosynthesis C-methylase UbiE
LASPLRRLVHNPGQIVGPYVLEGMTVLEPGPGMGFFTLEMARRVGPHGRVIAIDVQPKMLEVLVRRARRAGLSERIETHQPVGERLRVEDKQDTVDFALAFAMVHEVPQPKLLLGDLYSALRAGGKLLIAEPVGHVTAEEFELTLAMAKDAGFSLESRPVIRRSQAAALLSRTKLSERA